MNYFSVFLLMMIESSFIPFPSEVVIPPAVFVAETSVALSKTGIYVLDVFLIVVVGTLGATLGAVINYYLAFFIGRPIIYAFADSRLGRIMLLSSDKIKKAELYFNEHGNISTFIGRLIPAIRQLISIPAGLSRMNFKSFLFFTFCGAFAWNTVLAILGYIAHGQKNLIAEYSHELSFLILGILFIGVVFWLVNRFRKKS